MIMTPKPQKGNIHYSTALSGRRLSVTSSHALHTFILLTIILSSYHDIWYLINQSNKVQTKNSTKSKKQYLNIVAAIGCVLFVLLASQAQLATEAPDLARWFNHVPVSELHQCVGSCTSNGPKCGGHQEYPQILVISCCNCWPQSSYGIH